MDRGVGIGLLGLSSVEEELVEIKLALSAKLRKTREMGNLTQTDLAKRMGSSQSRVAKMEAGDPTVSLDLLVQGLLAAGATRRQIASAVISTSVSTTLNLTLSPTPRRLIDVSTQMLLSATSRWGVSATSISPTGVTTSNCGNHQ